MMPRKYINGKLTPRYEVRFPCPPVPTAGWTEDDWDAWAKSHGQRIDTEPDTLECGGTWQATGQRTKKGEMLYRLQEPGLTFA